MISRALALLAKTRCLVPLLTLMLPLVLPHLNHRRRRLFVLPLLHAVLPVRRDVLLWSFPLQTFSQALLIRLPAVLAMVQT